MELSPLLLSFVLAGLLVFQQIYFMRQIQKLVDKAMSRDFAEYHRVTQPVPERPKLPDYSPPPEDLNVLHRI